MSWFGNIVEAVYRMAARFRLPLAIAGIVLLALYALLSKLIGTVAFRPLTEQGSYAIVHLILDKVFLIALVAIVLSILAYIVPKIVPKSVLAPVPHVDYALAVFCLIDPSNDPFAATLSRIELFPGFPFFSDESNRPSAWPQRVWKDREALYAQFESFYFDPAVQAALKNDPAFNPESIKAVGDNGESPEARSQRNYVMSARSYLVRLLTDRGEDAVAVLLGPSMQPFLRLEQAREALHRDFPNRVAILRFSNTGRVDVPNLGVEFEVAGALYDCSINADPEKVRRSTWDFASQRISFDRLPRGYTVEVRLYYRYQSISERAFPDKVNFIQELTQGVRIANITATRTEVHFAPDLIAGLSGYERLYMGDARKKDSYDDELAVLFKKLGAEMSASMKKYDETHPTLKDLPLDSLATLKVPQAQIDNIWIAFRSPATRAYTAVHVFSHPTGPYILLSSKDRDRGDLLQVTVRLASAWQTETSDQLSDRSDDICITIPVPAGFTAQSVLSASHQLLNDGYTDFHVANVHYHTD